MASNTGYWSMTKSRPIPMQIDSQSPQMKLNRILVPWMPNLRPIMDLA